MCSEGGETAVPLGEWAGESVFIIREKKIIPGESVFIIREKKNHTRGSMASPLVTACWDAYLIHVLQR
jgi:hypothetical protein